MVYRSQNFTYPAILRIVNLTLSFITTLRLIYPGHNDTSPQKPPNFGQTRHATSSAFARAPPPSYQATIRRVQPSAQLRLNFCSFPRMCIKTAAASGISSEMREAVRIQLCQYGMILILLDANALLSFVRARLISRLPATSDG